MPEAPDLAVYRRMPTELRRVQGDGPVRVPLLSVVHPADIDRALLEGGGAGAVAVEWPSDRIIPLENLIARSAGRFEVWAIIEGARDVSGTLGALERGATVVVVGVDSPADLDRIEPWLEGVPEVELAWEAVAVVRVEPAGIGDRVLVDTTSLLRPEEGMLVGSVAAFLVHVGSEARGSRFSRARPFRVNAGAAHSYILMADGTTRYLSELTAGDRVLVTSPHGTPRGVRVGRVKVERRPMVLIEVERREKRYTVFLQEAETVRLSTDSGPVPTTSVGPGARVLGVPLAPARHLGWTVDETIEER